MKLLLIFNASISISLLEEDKYLKKLTHLTSIYVFSGNNESLRFGPKM